MAEKAHEIKAPDAAVVAQAQEKIADGDDLSKREQAAVEAQAAIDAQRGYTEIDWHGRKMYQSLLTGHTTESEYDMVQYHAELDGHGIVVARG